MSERLKRIIMHETGVITEKNLRIAGEQTKHIASYHIGEAEWSKIQ